MSTLPPPTLPPEVPVVPNPPKAHVGRRLTIIGVIVAVVIALGAVVAAAVSQSEPKLNGSVPSGMHVFIPEPETIHVNYTMTVYGESCRYIEYGEYSGYDDIPYTDIEVFDGSGNLLGFGSLGGGIPLDSADEDCSFGTSFIIDRSGDGMYRVTAGNEHRGFLNYTEADAPGNVLNVEASLG